MKFSIVTASFRQLPWLKRCVRSVADQGGVGFTLEHLVQDGGSGPELENWASAHTTAKFAMEPDTGVYDALNRGFARASGDILAFLNCDEQYLPGALARVAAAFREHPDAEMVVGDFLIIADDGRLLSFRRATPLRVSMILTDHLYDFTCAIFFRRSLWEKAGPFRTDFRAAGDAEWVSRALRNAPRVVYLHRYLSAFALTGENLSLRANAAEEACKLREITPAWARLAAPLLRHVRHVEKLLKGGYHSGPIVYEIYPAEDAETRAQFICERPTWRHPWAPRTIM